MTYKVVMLLFACIMMMSCKDDNIQAIVNENETPEMFTDGFSLDFVVTLDNMGGTRAAENPMAELESYIDPEKFRVLFFDREDRFLFESKSRWVKKIVPNEENKYSEWFVSVPLYDYGNDEAYGWKWEEIRRVLTGEDENDVDENGNPIYTKKDKNGTSLLPWAFKIAILANRPGTEWSMGMYGRDVDGNDMKDVELTPNKWKLQNGPFWNLDHTRWGKDCKTVFDLHHCQYDPIYDGKSYNDRGGVQQENKPKDDENGVWREFGKPNGGWWYQDLQVYDFIAGEVQKGEGFDEFVGRPTMGATSTWVSWKNEDNDKDTDITDDNAGIRKFVKLDKEHPIPMYGIQSFSKIGEDWVKGTPFNLSHIADGQREDDYDFKSISLLRSVVKLELIFPKTSVKPKVAMNYPNIYARCEPMNVWTPTDSIWIGDDQHDNDNLEGDCEWYRIRKYGPVSTNTDYSSGSAQYEGSVAEYKRVMKWFYGAWLEKGWPFKSSGPPEKNGLDYPQIFNSCVQRNGQVSCVDVDYSDLYSDNYYHFIVYTGEKNINDPSNISEMGKATNGAGPITSWWVRIGPNEYGFALAPHEGVAVFGDNYKDAQGNKYGENSATSAYVITKNEKPKSRFRHYEARVQGYTVSDSKQITSLAKNKMPWPLVRNHVYRIKIETLTSTRAGGGMSIQSEVLHSETINFDKPKKEKKDIEQPKKGTEKELSISRK